MRSYVYCAIGVVAWAGLGLFSDPINSSISGGVMVGMYVASLIDILWDETIAAKEAK